MIVDPKESLKITIEETLIDFLDRIENNNEN